MIEIRTRQVFYSPRRRRHFMTAIAAAHAEANARMRCWFPTEPADGDPFDGSYSPGWSWHAVPRLVAVHKRLVARYLRKLDREKGG
jgi:hypothetical protein